MARKPTRSPGDGVVVDTWYYDVEHVVGGGENDVDTRKTAVKKVEVKLRLIKDFEGETAPMATKKVSFLLVCDEIDMRIEGSDVEVMRAAMWEHLDERYKIRWEPWLLVRVDQRRPYEGSGEGFTFSYNEVTRGVAFDGSVLLREYKTYGRGYEVSAWPRQFKEKNGRTIACIKATKENVAALEQFAEQITAMRRRLAEFVAPDAIEEFLGNIHRGMVEAAAAEPRRLENRSEE